MKNLKKWIAIFITFIMAVSLFSMNVMAEDGTESPELPEKLQIVRFLVNDVDGMITESEDENTIVVDGLECSADITELLVEIWYTEDALIELVDDERLDGRRRDTDPLVPEFINFTNTRIFRLSRGEETKDYYVTVNVNKHDMGEWEVLKENSVTEKGEETRTCSNCEYQEVRETERLNRLADASKNRIEMAGKPEEYIENKKITFKAVGDGMDYAEPIEGDTRFLPVKWRVGLQETWKAFVGEAEFQLGEAGNYRINVFYQEEVFREGKWTATDKNDIKEVKFRILEAKKETKETRTPAVKTGEKEAVILYIGIAFVALAGLIASVRMKRKME